MLRTIASAVVALALPLAAAAQEPEPERIVLMVSSGLVNIDILVVNNADPVAGAGGDMALTDRGVMIARALDGAVAFYDAAADRMTTLRFRLPTTNAEMIPEPAKDGPRVDPELMRYQDIETIVRPDGLHLLVNHTHYDPENDCFSTRLDEALLPDDWHLPLGDGETIAELEWTTLLQGKPCLPVATERNAFGGNQAGGALVVTTGGTIYTTTGDLEFDGLGVKAPAVSDLEGSTYGRVFRIDPDRTVHEIARGLRNPQGLTMDRAGRLWVTDHGAMGGDELNVILDGADFGWPHVTLGVNYTELTSDAKFWPGNPEQGRHEGYWTPSFAWLPSIAPSAIRAISGFHPRWDGDLLVAALAGQSLRRIRLDGDRVIYDERIAVERRARALEIAGGRIYILFDDGRLGITTPHVMADR